MMRDSKCGVWWWVFNWRRRYFEWMRFVKVDIGFVGNDKYVNEGT